MLSFNLQNKGQSEFYQYLIGILFGMLIVISISLLFYSLHNSFVESNLRDSLTQLAIQTSDNIVKLSDQARNAKINPATNSSALISELDLSLPNEMGKRNYEIRLVTANDVWLQIQYFTSEGTNVSYIPTTPAAKVIARSTQSPLVTVEYVIPNINAYVQGFSANGVDDKLRYYRVNFNGTVTDRIVLGNSSVLIDLRTVS